MDRRKFLKMLFLFFLFPVRFLFRKKPDLWGGEKLGG
mgnify:CR=1 FL=1